MDVEIPYPELALRALEATAVPRLVAERRAVSLERLARGGGATRWFFIQELQQLEELAERLSPGSSLSFYFDDRIALEFYDERVAESILGIAAEKGDAVVGRLTAEGLEIAVEFVASRVELDDFARSFGPQERIFFGRFPGRESDSVNAVTLDLPDRDGIVRSHPH